MTLVSSWLLGLKFATGSKTTRSLNTSPFPVPPGAEGHVLCVRMLFVDYSLAFNTTVNMKITQKLWILGLYTSVCNWIVSFLTDRPQRLLMTHDCVAKQNSFRKCKGRGHNPIFGVRGRGGCLLWTPWCAHQWGPLLDHSHHCSFKDSTLKTGSPEKTERSWTECLCTLHLRQVNQLLAPLPSGTAAAPCKPFSTPEKHLKPPHSPHSETLLCCFLVRHYWRSCRWTTTLKTALFVTAIRLVNRDSCVCTYIYHITYNIH